MLAQLHGTRQVAKVAPHAGRGHKASRSFAWLPQRPCLHPELLKLHAGGPSGPWWGLGEGLHQRRSCVRGAGWVLAFQRRAGIAQGRAGPPKGAYMLACLSWSGHGAQRSLQTAWCQMLGQSQGPVHSHRFDQSGQAGRCAIPCGAGGTWWGVPGASRC